MRQFSTETIALIIICISSFTSSFMTSSINVALPSIQKELSADAVLLSWTVMVYILSATVLLVPFGKLADIYGRKRLFFIGMAFFAVTTFLCGITNSIFMLIFMRVLQGISASNWLEKPTTPRRKGEFVNR